MMSTILSRAIKAIPGLALLVAIARILGLRVPPRFTRWLAWLVVPTLFLRLYLDRALLPQ